MTVRGYRDLECWQRSMDLVVEGYELTERFPRKELYSLADQLQRALISVPSNIAESHSKSTREFIYRLGVAQGELSEAQTQVELAKKLRYISAEQAEKFLDHALIVAKQISALRRQVTLRLKEGKGSRGASMEDEAEEYGME